MLMFNYCLSGLHLDHVNQINDLKFLYVILRHFPHINYIVKVVHVLGLIRRHSSSFYFPKYFFMLYYVLVCAILENSIIVWFYKLKVIHDELF